MRKKELETYFNEHLEKYPQEVIQNGFVVYSEEYFHINHKDKTIYLEGCDLFKFSSLEGLENPGWIAVFQDPETKEHKFALGNNNPFSPEYFDIFPKDNGVVVGVPYSSLKKYQKKEIKVKKAKK